MRVLTIVGLVLVSGVAGLSAQHAHQIEFGGFGTYNRYDDKYGLEMVAGGGGRLGYFLSEYFGLEADVHFGVPYNAAGTFGTEIARGSLSFIINSGGQHNILYVLGGYTRSRWGWQPYPREYLNTAHFGIGDRIFFGNRVALRLEARGFYSPGDQVGNGITNPLDFTASAGLSVFLFGKGSGQAKPQPISQATKDSIIAAGGTLPPETPEPTRKTFVKSGVGWQRQWFWGAQAGVLSFNTDFDGFSAEPTFGGHWLITAKKTAMYVSYEQSFFLSDRHATITHPNGTIEPGNVAFDAVRRIMMGVLAFPVQKAVQPFGGVGFAIMEVLDPVATCTGCSTGDLAILQNAAHDAATKAFFWWMGGVDVRQGRLSLYGHYILTQQARGFLISGVTHTVQGGIRYSFGSSREDITAKH
jgi:hypothetical protein